MGYRLVNLIVLAMVFFVWTAVPAHAKPAQTTKTLIDDKGDKSFTFLPEMKMTSMKGDFGLLVGARFGLMLDHKFMIGVGGYGMTTPAYLPMGYGGVVVEYLPWSNRVAHISFGGLVGAGGLWATSFFAAEPEVRFNVNVNSWFRIAAGGGYRFVAGAGCANSRLRGPVATLSIGFGR